MSLLSLFRKPAPAPIQPAPVPVMLASADLRSQADALYLCADRLDLPGWEAVNQVRQSQPITVEQVQAIRAAYESLRG